MKLILLSGVAGVGKSTYIKENLADATVLSSDEIGAELGVTGGNNSKVFQTMYDRAHDLMSQKVDTIVLDATMLTRRRRLGALSQINPHNYGYEVEVVQLHKPLQEILKQNKMREAVVPEQTVKQMYLSMQPAKVGVDCDKYTLITPPFENYNKEVAKGIKIPHNSPYHKESIKEHIDMTVTKAIELYGNEHPVTTIARYHDLGKSVARTKRTHDELTSKFIERTIGEHDSYKGHENVSAMYYHIARQNEVDTDISDAILHHMNAHDSIDIAKNKSVIRSEVSPQAIDYMERFREIDSVSRVVDEDYVDMYKRMLQLDRDVKSYKESPSKDASLLIQLLAHEDIMLSMNAEDYTNPLFTFKYMHQGVDFSDNLIRNARGLTLDMNGEILTIGYEKFFNYKQLSDKDFYHYYDDKFREEFSELHDDHIYNVWEKLDGTFLTLGLDDNRFVAATSASTMTEFSKNAQEYFENHPYSDEIKQFIRDENMCLFFEYTSPENQIIIPYDKEEYTLIGARKKDINDHRIHFLSEEKLDELGLSSARRERMTLDGLLEYQRTNRETEGFVVQNEYGRLIKFKTDYWFEKHDNLGNIFFGKPYSRKNLIMLMDAIRDDTIDDLIAFDNQRKVEFHPVTMFKRVWDETINYYESRVHDYDEYSRQEIAGLDIPLYQKVAIYKYRDGESFRDVAHNPTLRKKLAIDVRDEILTDLVSSVDISELLDEEELKL
jgi:predicted kinase|nr:MAG TPA: putative kinase [Caudoviricetes sp.]